MGFYNLALFLCPRDKSDCTVSNIISLGVIGASWSSVTLTRVSNLKQEKAAHVVAGFTFFFFFFFFFWEERPETLLTERKLGYISLNNRK